MKLSLSSMRRTPGARRASKRVGRGEGSGSGKTCGRGQKGQMSRSGHKRKPGFEGGQMRLIRRIPKRGFSSAQPREWVPVNVGALAAFDEGTVVDVARLRSAGLIRDLKDGIKVLGDGDLGKKLTVRAQAFSASAKTKIEAAGGVCEVVALSAAS